MSKVSSSGSIALQKSDCESSDLSEDLSLSDFEVKVGVEETGLGLKSALLVNQPVPNDNSKIVNLKSDNTKDKATSNGVIPVREEDCTHIVKTTNCLNHEAIDPLEEEMTLLTSSPVTFQIRKLRHPKRKIY